MSESEIFSLVTRVVVMFALGCLTSLTGWWGMRGPMFTLLFLSLALFLTCIADITRHER